MVFLHSTPAAAFLAAAGFLVHGCPGTPFCFVVCDPTVLIAFLDVLSLPFLLVGVRRFVASWHGYTPCLDFGFVWTSDCTINVVFPVRVPRPVTQLL